MQDIFDLENLWDGLLSREADRIRQAYQSLDPASQLAVLAHLRRMAEEAGWHPQQTASARAALAVLEKREGG